MATIYAKNKITGEFEKVGPAANVTDSTLTLQGSPADAKATGDAINNIQGQIDDLSTSSSDGLATEDYVDEAIAGLGSLAKKSTVEKTDLSSAVQTSLSKADSALQSYTETDPTVPSWAKASTKPSYTKSEVGLGNVDNVKQYSASNPPPYPVASVNGKTGVVSLTASDVGADVSGTASSAVSAHNSSTAAHADIREAIETLSNEKADKVYVYPEDYGAVGDGTTDDSTAIQAAIDVAGNNAMVYLAKKTYRIDSGLSFSNLDYCNFKCDGTLLYTGENAAITASYTHFLTLDIFAIRAENGTAIMFDSTNGEVSTSIVSVKYITKSKIGIHIKADGANGGGGHSVFYNKIHVEGYIKSTGDAAIYIEPVDALINENIFWVGRIHGGCTYGVHINAADVFDGSAVNGNASRNIFYGGNFEGIADNGYSVCLHNSSLNVFHDWRTEEAYGQGCIKLSGECYGNDIGLSRIVLNEVDTSELTSTRDIRNVLRSPNIVGTTDDNLTGLNKVWLSYDEGFTSEYSGIMDMLQTETWIFTLDDGTVVEKQVVAT